MNERKKSLDLQLSNRKKDVSLKLIQPILLDSSRAGHLGSNR